MKKKPRVWTLFKGMSDATEIWPQYMDWIDKNYDKKPFPCEILIREIKK